MASHGNFTGLLKQADDEDPRCSLKLTGGINSQLTGLSVGNIFLSITAFCGNALILAALHKVSGLHPSSKFFYRNLAISDFLIGIVVEPVRITYWISVVKQQWTICRYSVVAFQSLSLSFGFCIFANNDGNKHRQTSFPAVRHQIQTDRNFETSSSNCGGFLGYVNCWCIFSVL